MSLQDLQVLQEVGISASDVARYCSVTRQAVSKGLDKEESYLAKPHRARRIFEILLSQGSRNLAQHFKCLLIKRLGVPPEEFVMGSVRTFIWNAETMADPNFEDNLRKFRYHLAPFC